jgi:N-acetyl-gamma-glutamyl-phosphate reductase
MEIVPGIIQKKKKVIDLSADFRFNKVSTYESAYQPHTAKALAEKAVYGLCEVYFEEIRGADLIGNPGCYPTSVLLPLVPLLKQNVLDLRTLVADSKSGVSGAGRSLVITSHFCEVHESFKAYKVAQHRHNPEMEEVLSREAGKPVTLTFVPHLVPMSRGMLTTLYAELALDADAGDIRECIASYYEGRRFVRLSPEGNVPDTLDVRGTNYCEIGITVDKHANRLVMTSAIDNLVKGAAGQAVQNMNIMLGLDEATGLTQVPLPL